MAYSYTFIFKPMYISTIKLVNGYNNIEGNDVDTIMHASNTIIFDRDATRELLQILEPELLQILELELLQILEPELLQILEPELLQILEPELLQIRVTDIKLWYRSSLPTDSVRKFSTTTGFMKKHTLDSNNNYDNMFNNKNNNDTSKNNSINTNSNNSSSNNNNSDSSQNI
eukprot:XP_014774957.1 PREDICTED: probable serine/threonine-protein kinase irlF [Octopus bimaculoides]